MQNEALKAEIIATILQGGRGGESTAGVSTDCVKDDKIVELEANITRRTGESLQMVLDAIKNSRSAVLDNLAQTADKKQLTEALAVGNTRNTSKFTLVKVECRIEREATAFSRGVR